VWLEVLPKSPSDELPEVPSGVLPGVPSDELPGVPSEVAPGVPQLVPAEVRPGVPLVEVAVASGDAALGESPSVSRDPASVSRDPAWGAVAGLEEARAELPRDQMPPEKSRAPVAATAMAVARPRRDVATVTPRGRRPGGRVPAP
jgi:hypothetical protein